jgi:hypothetical protein
VLNVLRPYLPDVVPEYISYRTLQRYHSFAAKSADFVKTGLRPPPLAATVFLCVKGVLHLPAATPTLKQETRDAILLAIAKARSWIDQLTSGRIQSFTQLAQQERKVERHIRLLIPSRSRRLDCHLTPCKIDWTRDTITFQASGVGPTRVGSSVPMGFEAVIQPQRR